MLFLVDNLMKWGTTCFFEYQFVKEDWNEVLLKCNICWKIGSWDYELDWAKQNLQKIFCCSATENFTVCKNSWSHDESRACTENNIVHSILFTEYP